MPFKLVLQGQKEIILTDLEADHVRTAWKTKSQAIITIGRTSIAVNTIRGIFDITAPKNPVADAEWLRGQNEWDNQCLEQSRMDPEKKTFRELEIRIKPIYKSILKKPLAEVDQLYQELYAEILAFFNANPRYPRCPAWVWWKHLEPVLKVRSPFTKYFEYVRRNDSEIDKWCKLNEISLNSTYQEALPASNPGVPEVNPSPQKPS